MAVPGYQALMLPLLRIAGQGETALQSAVDALVREFGLNADEAAQRLASGQLVIYNRTGWAKTELVKAGLIEQPRRGVFRATDEGRRLLTNPPPSISRAYLIAHYPDFKRYIEWAQSKSSSDDEPRPEATAAELAEAPAEATPDEQIDAAAKTLTAALEADVLSRVRSVPPEKFEQIVVDLLIAMGFGGGDPEMGKRLGRTGDGGIDGVIQEDALGLDAIYIQAKRYQEGSNISSETLQAFVGSLVGHRANKGVFVTSSKFTAPAKSYVLNVQHRVVLIDGEELARLLVRHGVCVREDRRVIIKKLDEEYFAE